MKTTKLRQRVRRTGVIARGSLVHCAVTLGFALLAGAGQAHEFSGPQGTVEVDWQVPNVARISSASYGDVFGIEASVKQGFPETLEIDGKSCVSGSLFLFDVSDEFAFDIDETIVLEILFDRRRSTGFWLSYDRNALAEPLQEVRFEPSDEQWLSYTIEMPRARFANRGEGGSDFAIAGLSAMWPGIPDENHRITLCGLGVARPDVARAPAASGHLEIEIRDEMGRPTAARLGLYDDTGRMPLPGDDALTIRNYDDRQRQVFLRATHAAIPPWAHDNRHIFYADGRYSADLPAGPYTLLVSKGPEYEPVIREIDIAAGGSQSVTLDLGRWIDMPAAGWYAGDDHVHMTRNHADNASIGALMRAEDIHVTNVLQMGNPAGTHFHQYAFGGDGRYVDGRYALVPGVEDPRTAIRGHTISLNIAEVVRGDDVYLQYDHIFDAYRQQGGMSGYAHVAGDLFNVGRGLAVDVPLGVVDFVEVLQDGILATDTWYDFLNLGYRLVPTAGSDFPYLGVPGAERNMVHVGERFSVDAWYAALAAGRTFVTNGPMLELAVDGAQMGATLHKSGAATVQVTAAAAARPGGERLARLELVVHGRVVATATDVSEGNTVELQRELSLETGAWLAIRAYGVEQALAHSAPVYVDIGERGFADPDAVPEIATRMLGRLEQFDSVTVDANAELETWSVGEPLSRMFEAQRARILQRVDDARRIYAAMLDR